MVIARLNRELSAERSMSGKVTRFSHQLSSAMLFEMLQSSVDLSSQPNHCNADCAIDPMYAGFEHATDSGQATRRFSIDIYAVRHMQLKHV